MEYKGSTPFFVLNEKPFFGEKRQYYPIEIIPKKMGKNKSYIRICIAFFHSGKSIKIYAPLYFEMKGKVLPQDFVC